MSRRISGPRPHRVRSATLGAAVLLGALITGTSAAQAATYPGNQTYSRYVTTTDMYTVGCNQGKASDSQGQHHQVAILSFGDPGWINYGSWGAWDNYIGGFNSNATIENNVKRYMQGFWDCTVPGSKSFMTVAPGETNAGSGINSTTAAASALGSAWGSMIKDLNSWIAANGYGVQLTAFGAIDAEPGWGPPSYVLAWASGYMSAAGAVKYYDFGSADGCPPYGGCNNGWSQATEYQMAWGNANAIAIPEIYNNAQAQQWAAISAWGNAHTSSGPILWAAALSQYQACIDHGDPCTGTDNTPYQSWQELTSASGTAPYYVTEMSYQSI
ncbi:MAG TPA: hypothetical protein VGS97_11440 [Actinocrinis sp.]|uniref:hypothetical protein n=1 Tax=Actinocrinis sp. TaxID=1920516 RepID=UPI002DDD3380|nr:hypothetical protein [Actinocrinis sp.]HEV2344699.1 hypothetical protein [Actinocrinis sp.]